MAFLSPHGGLYIVGDIVRDKFNLQTGELEERGNNLQPFPITLGMHCSYDPQDEAFKELVWSGTPEPKKPNEHGGMNWLTLPVWRVVTNRFNDQQWERFLNYYIKQVELGYRPNGNRGIWYQPDLADVEIRDYDPIPLHFSLKQLDFIMNEKCLLDNTITIFDEALRNSQVNNPKTKMMTADQQKRFKKAIEYRRAQEQGAVDYDADEPGIKVPDSSEKKLKKPFTQAASVIGP